MFHPWMQVAALAEDQDPNFRSTEKARNSDEVSTNPNRYAALSTYRFDFSDIYVRFACDCNKKKISPSNLKCICYCSNGNNLPEALESTNNTCHLDELTNEMALLKERNILMEAELKEMQERYSEISLKFAEVEGERQQLVMKVRNLKNAKKRS